MMEVGDENTWFTECLRKDRLTEIEEENTTRLDDVFFQ